MSTVSIEEAQAQLPELIEKTQAGEEILITHGGRLVAKLVGQPRARRPRQPGTLKGTVAYMAPDFNARLDVFMEYMPILT